VRNGPKGRGKGGIKKKRRAGGRKNASRAANLGELRPVASGILFEAAWSREKRKKKKGGRLAKKKEGALDGIRSRIFNCLLAMGIDWKKRKRGGKFFEKKGRAAVKLWVLNEKVSTRCIRPTQEKKKR